MCPDLAIDADEAQHLEARRGLLRIRAPQDCLGRVDAHVEHGPDPLGGDGEELLPGAMPTAEEEG
jgi:hypothetical protein